MGVKLTFIMFACIVLLACEQEWKTVDKVLACTSGTRNAVCRVEFSDGTRGDVLAPTAPGDVVYFDGSWNAWRNPR